jgi:DNA (cytosine-5)-methyltransferase 1
MCVRKLTIDECYKLMGFPKEFIKDKNKSNAYKQCGNSVVVPMIEEVVKNIIKQIYE